MSGPKGVRGLAVLLCGLFFLGGMGIAMARSKPTKTSVRLDAVLAGLEWGQSHEKVLAALEKIVMDDFRNATIGMTDLSRTDRIRKQYVDKVDRIKSSFMQLAGDATASLEVSIVGTEFLRDNNEAVIVVRDDVATKYLFFVNNQLYKVAVAYDPSYIGGMAYDTFARATSDKYGPVFDEKLDEDGFVVETVWEDTAGHRLRLLNMEDTYDTFLMVFTEVGLESAVLDKHVVMRAKRSAGPSVSSDIDALTEGEDARTGSAVDALIGVDTRVDLMAGIPEEERLAMEAGEDDETKKKKKAKESNKKRTKKKSGGDKSKEKGAGIVIY